MTRLVVILHSGDREATIETAIDYAVGDLTPPMRVMDRWGVVWSIPAGEVAEVEEPEGPKECWLSTP